MVELSEFHEIRSIPISKVRSAIRALGISNTDDVISISMDRTAVTIVAYERHNGVLVGSPTGVRYVKPIDWKE